MIEIPQLPPDFWTADPVLQHIRDAAHSTPEVPSPDAVLGVCLCRVAAMTPLEAVLPGVGGTVNYLAGIVGPSGAGKSTAHRLARRLIPDIGTELDSVPIGSGEGMIEAYLDRSGNRSQIHRAAYFYVDEAETFLASGRRDASTTGPTLRAMWSGAEAGSMNASKDTTRRLRDGSYRFAAALGFQPAYAMALIEDDRGGTPQRFVFFSALDRYCPNVGPSDPGPLTVPLPEPRPIHVAPEISRLLTERRRRITRGDEKVDPLETHLPNVQQRTAALLSILCGDPAGVCLKWWNLARPIVDTSSAIVRTLLAEKDRAAAVASQRKVLGKLETEDFENEQRLDRIGHRFAKVAARKGPVTRAVLGRDGLNGLERNQNVDRLVVAALERGWLKVAPGSTNQYVAGPRWNVGTLET